LPCLRVYLKICFVCIRLTLIISGWHIEYILLTTSDVQKCSTGSITVCPVFKVLYGIRSVTCESKLYFQTAAKGGRCRRNSILHYETSTLLRHEDVWVFHFSSRRQLAVRCPWDNTWETYTQMLSGAGLIQNAIICCITAVEVRTLPELYETVRAHLHTPLVYEPYELPILTVHEIPDVKMAVSTGVNELEQRKNHLKLPRKFLHVDKLFHIQNAARAQTKSPRWHIIVATTSCALTTTLKFYFLLRSKFQ
jgi:hypothetical protein